MREQPGCRWWAVVALAALAGAAAAPAVTVTDVHTDDLNVITAVVQNDGTNTVTVYESYGEDNVVPYASHDTKALVDYDPGEELRWFDKIVEIEQGDDLSAPWRFEFVVTNDSPAAWSDYHFEFWTVVQVPGTGELAFGERDTDFTLVDASWASSTYLSSSAYPGPWQGAGVLEFWADSPADWQGVGQTNTFTFAVSSSKHPLFGIRQVATVPEPLTLLGVFGGVAGVGAYIRKRRTA